MKTFNPNTFTFYDESLAHETLEIELTEIDGIKIVLFHNPGPILQKFHEDRHMVRMIGIEEIDDLERGGNSRKEALQEIWDKANESFRSFVARGYSSKEALELAREKDLEELDYLRQINLDPNGELRAERINAFNQIESRERAISSSKSNTWKQPGKKERKNKFHWPWQNMPYSAIA